MSVQPPGPIPNIQDVFNLSNYKQITEGLTEADTDLLYLKLTGGTLTGTVASTSTIDSTLSTNGAITTLGGVGVAKKLTVGDRIKSEDTTDAISTTTGSIIASGGISASLQIRSGGVCTSDRFVSISGTSPSAPSHQAVLTGYGMYHQTSPLGLGLTANNLAQVVYLSTSVAQYSCGQQYAYQTDALATYTLLPSNHFYTNTRNTTTTTITLPLATVGTEYVITGGQSVASNCTIVRSGADQFVSGGVFTVGPLTLALNFTMTLRCVKAATWHYISQ